MGVWDHIPYQVVDWEARLIFWQAGYRAALQPIQYLTLNLPECWKIGQKFPPGCILLLHQPKPTLDGWCAPGSGISPPQSHTGCFVLLSHLSQPPYPSHDKWLQTQAFLICPQSFIFCLLSLLHVSFAENCAYRGFLTYSVAGCLTACSDAVPFPEVQRQGPVTTSLSARGCRTITSFHPCSTVLPKECGTRN